MIDEICGRLNIQYKKDAPMAEHTTFRIGGRADYLVNPDTIDKLISLVKELRDNRISFFVIGKGSNVLIKDGGYRGVIIQLNDGFDHIECSGSEVTVGAGVYLPRLSSEMAEKELEGLEFAWGIPGTLGGSLIMNAGAFGSCMGNVVKEILTLSCEGELKKLRKEEIMFNYRSSSLKERKEIVLEATLSLERGEGASIREKMNQLKKKRKTSQPPQPSAGSIFRNPPESAAGKLIEDAGLKGKVLGGAAISDIHANFIVNKGNARAVEVMELIKIVKKEIKKTYNIDLILEIEVIGEE